MSLTALNRIASYDLPFAALRRPSPPFATPSPRWRDPPDGATCPEEESRRYGCTMQPTGGGTNVVHATEGRAGTRLERSLALQPRVRFRGDTVPIVGRDRWSGRAFASVRVVGEARSSIPYGMAFPGSRRSRKTCVSTSAGSPSDSYSRPPYSSWSAISFFWLSTPITGHPASRRSRT